MEPMRCARCSFELRPERTEHGLIWLCGSCATGAATLGVIRKVAPRRFVQQLWQAARSHARPDAWRCPSCTQPLLTFEGTPVEASPSVRVCCRCFLIVLAQPEMEAFRLGKARLHAPQPTSAALPPTTGGVR